MREPETWLKSAGPLKRRDGCALAAGMVSGFQNRPLKQGGRVRDEGHDRSGWVHQLRLCAGTCPEVFQMADDGLAEVYRAPTGENEEQVRMAADGCPVAVIHIED